MNKTAIHNIAIAILTLPVFILSVFKPIVKVFSKLSKIFYSQWKRTEFKTCPRNVIIEYKIEVGAVQCDDRQTLHDYSSSRIALISIVFSSAVPTETRRFRGRP